MLCSGCDVFCLYCEAWSYRCSCIGSVVFRHADVVCLCASCDSLLCQKLCSYRVLQ